MVLLGDMMDKYLTSNRSDQKLDHFHVTLRHWNDGKTSLWLPKINEFLSLLVAGELAQRMEAAFWHFIQVMKYGSWSHEIDKMFLAKLCPKDLDMEVDQAWLEGVQLGACH